MIATGMLAVGEARGPAARRPVTAARVIRPGE